MGTDMATDIAKATLRIALALALIAAAAPAEAASFSFKSEVKPAQYTRTIAGELALPKGKGPFPAVIFLPPCNGIRPAVKRGLEAHAAALTQAGFAVLYFDSIRSRGMQGGEACGGRFMIPGLNAMADDAFNARTALARSPKIDADNIFVAGESLGAMATVRVSTKAFARHDGAYRAAAAWYPKCNDVMGAELKSPLLVLGGSADDWTPPSNCLRAKRMKLVSGADYEVIVADGARHGFDQPGPSHRYHGHLLAYDAKATAAGRKAMIAFFKAHMKK